MLKFIVDTQLPPSLSEFLRSAGNDAKHTTDFPDGHLLKDAEIIRIAIQEERIVVTKDRDFLDYYLLKGIPPRVLLLQFGNIGNPALIRFFTVNQTQLEQLFNQGAEMVLFSREQITEYRQ